MTTPSLPEKNPAMPTLTARRVLKRIEETTGTRFCRECDALLPVDRFDLVLKNAPRFLCVVHTKKLYHTWSYGTHNKRAFSTLRAKLQADRYIFGQDRTDIKQADLIKMVTPEHLENFGEWEVIPRNPSIPISGANAALVSVYIRRALVRRWKKNKDSAEYTALLEQMLQHGMQMNLK